MAEHEADELAPEVGGSPSPARDLGVSAALTLVAARKRRKSNGDERLDAVLEKQARMLDAQLEHMHEQRELQLSRLRWSLLSDRMRAGLQLMTAFVGLVIAAAIIGAMWQAARSDSIVVDSFHAPPAVAAQGLDGTVVASGVLDEMERLQVATRPSRAKRGVRNAWSNDIRLEVPETGVSIGEIRRYLHEWLGRETHISGDLVQEKDGLILTVRGSGLPARSFTGTDLKILSIQAAEYVYGGAEPYAFASLLGAAGRDAEAIAFAKATFPLVDPEERPWLLNAWGNALADIGRPREGLAKHREAARLKPDYWTAWSNVVNDKWTLGDDEGAIQASLDFERMAERRGTQSKAPQRLFINGDILRNDWFEVRAAQIQNAELNGGGGAGLVQAAPVLALAAAMLHDPEQIDYDLEMAKEADKDPFTVALAHFAHGWSAFDRGDSQTAVAQIESFGAAYANPAVGSELPGLNCWVAPIEEMAGHPEKADAALSAGGHHVDCYRFRADILDHRGDWSGAQTAYAEAVALAPDLPAPYYSWGLALARHGELDGANAKYALASKKGPHWADPLKAWGDALAAQRRFTEADAKYAEAAKYAPKWAALRDRLGP